MWLVFHNVHLLAHGIFKSWSGSYNQIETEFYRFKQILELSLCNVIDLYWENQTNVFHHVLHRRFKHFAIALAFHCRQYTRRNKPEMLEWMENLRRVLVHAPVGIQSPAGKLCKWISNRLTQQILLMCLWAGTQASTEDYCYTDKSRGWGIIQPTSLERSEPKYFHQGTELLWNSQEEGAAASFSLRWQDKDYHKIRMSQGASIHRINKSID